MHAQNGGIASVRNLRRGIALISRPAATPPFRVELAGIGVVDTFIDFVAAPLANGMRLTWTLPHDITLTSDVIARGEEITFTVSALNQGQTLIDRIEYPIIGGIGRIGEAGQDELVHTHATGMLFHDPLDLFDEDPENHRRLRLSPYPEGFSGSTMQFMAYYGRGKGGFYLGTEDGRKDLKWFNFYKQDDSLHASIMHRPPLLEEGRSYNVLYPVVLAALEQGSWYEAADRYRTWAWDQSWAQPAPRSKWLMEEVGICTFGINARYDRAAWIDGIDKMAGTPVFHILGPNWATWGHDYHNNLPRGKADWFPATFHAENMRVIRENGDYWAPFEFDLLAHHNPAYPDPIVESWMMQNDPERGLTNPGLAPFQFMCPGTDYWHDFHVERDERLVQEYGANALYYDISVSNLLLQCLAHNHNHLPGSGSTLADLFTTMYRDTSAAMTRAAGVYTPFGTEVISEIFVNTFDYYQARAEAGPYAPFEVQAFRDWLIAGSAEKIPLFKYVFQERSPLRLDGWARPAVEVGDLFYWTAAQVLLNGGLLELNYEFAQLEDRDGRGEDPAEHYYTYQDRHFTLDSDKMAFVGEVARARVGAANPFLACGRMLPAPRVDAAPVALDYKTVNVSYSDPIHDDEGSMQVTSVLASAWQLGDRVVYLAANLLADAQTVSIDGKTHMLPPRKIQIIEP